MILNLKIKPNAKKNEISIDAQGNIKVKVHAPPVDGKANKELIGFLSEVFKIPKSHIEILSGETNQYKKIKVIGEEGLLKNIFDGIQFNTKLKNKT